MDGVNAYATKPFAPHELIVAYDGPISRRTTTWDIRRPGGLMNSIAKRLMENLANRCWELCPDHLKRGEFESESLGRRSVS